MGTSAIVELPAEGTRVFLEDELDVGPLPRRDESAQAWALSKPNRYASFMVQGSHRTFYAQKYPDGWKAELVLLVHFDERASNLDEVIREWANAQPRRSAGRTCAQHLEPEQLLETLRYIVD